MPLHSCLFCIAVRWYQQISIPTTLLESVYLFCSWVQHCLMGNVFPYRFHLSSNIHNVWWSFKNIIFWFVPQIMPLASQLKWQSMLPHIYRCMLCVHLGQIQTVISQWHWNWKVLSLIPIQFSFVLSNICIFLFWL